MAHTNVNNAFHRILAPPGMSECFILPSVSTQLLLREGVDGPDHLLHLLDVSPQLMGFSWALCFCPKMVEILRPVSWLRCGRHAHGSSPGTCDVSGFSLLVSPTKIEEGWKQVRRRREERVRARARAHLSASPLGRVVLPRTEPGHRCYGPTIHGHAQRVPGLCQNVAGRPEVTGKVGRDGGGDAGTHVLSGYGHGAGDHLMAAIKFVGWIRNFSDLTRAVALSRGLRQQQ